MAQINLALGGGGVRGVAHMGVYEELLKRGFSISAIAGTSAGGIFGALFAAGIDLEDLKVKLKTVDDRKFFSRKVNDPPSLMGLSGLIDLLKYFLGDKSFGDLKIPFAVTSVDLNTNQEIIINNGKLSDAILATVAIPGIFPPRMMDGFELVDGGVVDPVPVAVARWLNPHQPVVAVCLHPVPEEWAMLPELRAPIELPIPQPIRERFERLRVSQAMRIYIKASDITMRTTGELRMQLEKPEIILRPDIAQIGVLDHVIPQELIDAGSAAVTKNLAQIRNSVSWYNRLSRQRRTANPPGRLLTAQNDT